MLCTHHQQSTSTHVRIFSKAPSYPWKYQDHRLSYATTLQKDKDHFLLDLLYDKPRGHLELKRFDNHEMKINAK